MNWTREQLLILTERDNAAILRDLRHTPGWEVYKQLAASRIEQMKYKFWRTTLSEAEAWDERLRLQAIADFQNTLEDVVENAVELLDPVKREELLYSFQQGWVLEDGYPT